MNVKQFSVGDEVVLYWTDHPPMIAVIEGCPCEGDELWYMKYLGHGIAVNTGSRSFSYMAMQNPRPTPLPAKTKEE